MCYPLFVGVLCLYLLDMCYFVSFLVFAIVLGRGRGEGTGGCFVFYCLVDVLLL